MDKGKKGQRQEELERERERLSEADRDTMKQIENQQDRDYLICLQFGFDSSISGKHLTNNLVQHFGSDKEF